MARAMLLNQPKNETVRPKTFPIQTDDKYLKYKEELYNGSNVTS